MLVGVNFTSVGVRFEAWLLLAYVPICFASSNVLSKVIFKNHLQKSVDRKIEATRCDKLLFVFASVVGLVGLYLYARDFSAELGGLEVFFYTFFDAPLEIRALAQDVTSVGFQLSYFSWISISYCVFYIYSDAQKPRAFRIFLYSLGASQFLLNLLFIDRTRPITLFVVSALMIFILKMDKLRRPSRLILYVLLVPIGIFILQALFTKKYDLEEGVLDNLSIYLFGGFGYFSSLLHDVYPNYELTRTFLPISKVLEGLGLIKSVPSQILEFRNVPFSTNVGTFLEPMLSDGGPVFLIIAAPILIVLVDLIALMALGSRSIIGLFMWANLILLSLLSFFVPKFNSTYMYLFYATYIAMRVAESRVRGRV